MIRIKGHYGDLERELTRVERMPDPKTVQALNAVLRGGFAATQEAVHVETGALKESGKSSSETDKIEAEWRGTIIYGDLQGPVDYAIYEARRGVGGAGGISDAKGDHDFMRPLEALDQAYVEALLKGLAG